MEVTRLKGVNQDRLPTGCKLDIVAGRQRPKQYEKDNLDNTATFYTWSEDLSWLVAGI